MCKNAQQYNEESSLIYEDSLVLERVYHNARRHVDQWLAQPPANDTGQSRSRASIGSFLSASFRFLFSAPFEGYLANFGRCFHHLAPFISWADSELTPSPPALSPEGEGEEIRRRRGRGPGKKRRRRIVEEEEDEDEGEDAG